MVPWVPQHTASSLCFPASLQMVIQFYTDHHDGRARLAGMTRPSLDQIIGTCHTSMENGTKISDDLTQRLSTAFPQLEFDLLRGYTLEGAQSSSEKGIPPILIYDGRYLLLEQRGPAHAGVYVGCAPNSDPILNNPWLGQGYATVRARFEAAWDIRGRKAVIVKLKPQTTLVGSEPNGAGPIEDR
jgi:hypothetical protein